MTTPVNAVIDLNGDDAPIKADESKDFVFDLNRWNYKQFKAFRRAIADDNEEIFFPMLQKVLIEWPFNRDINAPGVLDDLGLEEITVLLSAVNKAAERLFRRG